MMQALRIIGILLFLPLAYFAFMLGAQPIDQSSARHNLEKAEAELADIRKMGEFTERVRIEEGRLATSDELFAWIETQDFRTTRFDRTTAQGVGDTGGILLRVLPVGEELILGEESDLSTSDGHTYRIAYSFGTTQEFAPETGAHNFPTSVDDYKPGWIARGFLLALALALGFCIIQLMRSVVRGFQPS